MRSKYDIYISYCHADYESARMLVDFLQEQGYSCFVVEFNNIYSGTFDEQIFEAITSSKYFLLLYSQHVESSQYIRREVEFAHENGINILPVLLTEFEEVSWYKEILAKINPFEFYDRELSSEKGVQLINWIINLIGEPEKRRQPSADSSELIPTGISSFSDKASTSDKSHNSVPESKFHFRERVKEVIIIIVIVLLMIGLGLYFSNWFILFCAGDREYDDDYREYNELDYEAFALDSCKLQPSFQGSRNHEEDFPVVADSTIFQDSTQNNQSIVHSEISGNRLGFVSEDLCKYLTLIIIVLCGTIIYKLHYYKRKNVKITCNKSAIINIDGNPIAELEAHKVHNVHLSKGMFIVDFQLISDKTKHVTKPVSIIKVNKDIIVEGNFHSLLNEMTAIKVFIAGSTKLVAERDALRSVISQMHNIYKEDNLLIEAYSFDDFPREFTEGGHQKLYDNFIRDEASWVVFITDGEMGEKTIWELENAIKAFKSDNRPKILMYSKPEKTQSSQNMSAFRKLLLEENQYWIDYSSLDDIKTSFREHLQWDLYNLMMSQFKKI